jgi:hypothetical protein
LVADDYEESGKMETKALRRTLQTIGCGLALILAACGADPGAAPAPAGLPRLPAPASLGRSTSAQVARLIVAGSDYIPDAQQNCSPDTNDAVLDPGSDHQSFAALAYAIYELNAGEGSGSGRLKLTWTLPPGVGTRTFIGLANFSADRWQWFPLPGASAEIPDMTPYIDPDGRILVAVVLSPEPTADGEAAQLNSITLSLSDNGLGEIPVPGYDADDLELVGLYLLTLADGRIGMFILSKQVVFIQGVGHDEWLSIDYVVSTDASARAWSTPEYLQRIENPAPFSFSVQAFPAVIGGAPSLLYKLTWADNWVPTDWRAEYLTAIDTGGTEWNDAQLVDEGVQADNYTLKGLGETGGGYPAYTCHRGAFEEQFCSFRRAADPYGATWADPVFLPQASGQSGSISNPILLEGRPAVFTYGNPDRAVYSDGYLHRALDVAGTQWESPIQIFQDWHCSSDMIATVLPDGRAAIFMAALKEGDAKGGTVFFVAEDSTNDSWPAEISYFDWSAMPGLPSSNLAEARAGDAFFYWFGHEHPDPRELIHWNSMLDGTSLGTKREFIFPWNVDALDATLLQNDELLVAAWHGEGDDFELTIFLPPDP